MSVFHPVEEGSFKNFVAFVKIEHLGSGQRGFRVVLADVIPVEQLVDDLQEEIREMMAGRDICVALIQILPSKSTERPCIVSSIREIRDKLRTSQKTAKDAFVHQAQIITEVSTAIPDDVKLE
jgi:hypothetical protein